MKCYDILYTFNSFIYLFIYMKSFEDHSKYSRFYLRELK